ncbi:hypothetical protein ABFP60_02770 [Clostridioides difficile]
MVSFRDILRRVVNGKKGCYYEGEANDKEWEPYFALRIGNII